MASPAPAHQGGLLRLGALCWAIVGMVIVFTMVVGLLAAVSEIVLPLVFAVLLGATAYPLARWLQARGLPPAIAALVVVVALLIIAVGVVLLTVQAVVHETSALAVQIDHALDELSSSGDGIGLTADVLDRIRGALASAAAFIGRGMVTALVGGVSAVIGFVGGAILAMLIMYYVLKDGPYIRNWMVCRLPAHLHAEAGEFLSSAVRSVRGYWAGRSALSAAVTVVIVGVSMVMGLPLIATIAVVNFLGGFVPYIGAFIGGGLASLLALSHGGISQALVMLGIVLACNLLLENVLEPRIMSERLRIHPLLVLVATTAGGVIGGIVGLVLAVPVTVITLDLLQRLHRLGVFTAARSKSEPLLRSALAGALDGQAPPAP